MNVFPYREKRISERPFLFLNLSGLELLISFAEYPGANGFTQRLNNGRMLEHAS
jgi:hypothetical protein